jgi:PAS domain S-box-containing protein
MCNDSINELLSIIRQKASINQNILIDLVKQNPVYTENTKMIITSGRKIVYATKRFCALISYDCEDLKQTDVRELIPAQDHEILQNWINRLLDKHQVSYMLRGITGEGNYIWLKVSSIYLNESGLTLSLFTEVGQSPAAYGQFN